MACRVRAARSCLTTVPPGGPAPRRHGAVAAPVVHLVAGTETHARARTVGAGAVRVSADVQPGRIWQIVLTGIGEERPGA